MNESSSEPTEKLVRIGFSEYEAKAYVALLRKNPVTGYELSKQSGVPRSMIYEVLGKLTTRGAAMKLQSGGTTKYSPVPAENFLDQLRREHEKLVDALKDDLTVLATVPDLEYVWNIEGHVGCLWDVATGLAGDRTQDPADRGECDGRRLRAQGCSDESNE